MQGLCSSALQAADRREAIGRLRRLHGPQNSLGHHTRPQCPHDILISGHIAQRNSVDAVPVCRGMHRADGARIPVLCHASDLAQPGFVKPGVRKDNTDRCIADKFVFLYLNALQCKQLGVEEGPAVIRQQACGLAAVS